jgi:hypothetical protein
LDQSPELKPFKLPSTIGEVTKPFRGVFDVGDTDAPKTSAESHKRPALRRRHAQKTASSVVSLPRTRTTSNNYFGEIGDGELMTGALLDIKRGTSQSFKSFSQTGSVRPISPLVTSIPQTSFRSRLPSSKSIKDSLLSGIASARESFRQKWNKQRSRHAGFRSDWRSARYSIKPRSRTCSRFTGYISDTVSHMTEFLKNRTREEQYSVGPYDENKLESMPDPIRRIERTLSQESRDQRVATLYREKGFGLQYPTMSTDRRKRMERQRSILRLGQSEEIYGKSLALEINHKVVCSTRYRDV